jgi:hypothetical protein
VLVWLNECRSALERLRGGNGDAADVYTRFTALAHRFYHTSIAALEPLILHEPLKGYHLFMFLGSVILIAVTLILVQQYTGSSALYFQYFQFGNAPTGTQVTVSDIQIEPLP